MLHMGNLAEKLHSAINQEVGMVTMLLRINDDDKTLTSFQSNEDSQEDNNKQVDQSGKRGQRDKWLLFPTKNIQEMITSTQVSCY
ncbi:hypothetical protein HID58_022525 [Brassica napus]|uniref:Uncharacterized protein n=1 Tax=Brassica napus TaxID=3708 RepID=A0ABQ8D0E9_BRANA|nr:hypothetical protein HID58_022525 [Brassica napus]